MKAQAASPPFTPIYASLIAVINSKFPMIGQLLIMRIVSQFRRAYKRSDKLVCLATTKFIAHLVNQKVVNEIVALQLLTLLLERPTDDSVEVAVGFMREVGAFLVAESSKASTAVFERFRAILHEGQIDKRTQYMVEVLFQVRKDKFIAHPSIPEGLDIVDEENQIIHMVGLTDELQTMDLLNVFQADEQFLENEQKYQDLKKEILGDSSDDDSEASDAGEEEEENHEEVELRKQIRITDETNTNMVNLRRGIYLTIMSSINFEECAHKLMKIDIHAGQEIELCNMIIECCSQERTYVNFYGLLGQRFCNINVGWAKSFAQAFEETYKTIHRFETNRLRNIAKYFAHLLATDAITWEIFALIRLTEDSTTSSSRIFCKILFTELVQALGLPKLNTRLSDPTMVVQIETNAGVLTRGVFDGLFPKDNPRDTRFAINYFTSIGLGSVTEGLREWLKNAPKPIVAPESDSSDSDSDSSSSGSSSSGSSSSSASSHGSRHNEARGRLSDTRKRESIRGSPAREVLRDDTREKAHDRVDRGDLRRGYDEGRKSGRTDYQPDLRPSRRNDSRERHSTVRREYSRERRSTRREDSRDGRNARGSSRERGGSRRDSGDNRYRSENSRNDRIRDRNPSRNEDERNPSRKDENVLNAAANTNHPIKEIESVAIGTVHPDRMRQVAQADEREVKKHRNH